MNYNNLRIDLKYGNWIGIYKVNNISNDVINFRWFIKKFI